MKKTVASPNSKIQKRPKKDQVKGKIVEKLEKPIKVFEPTVEDDFNNEVLEDLEAIEPEVLTEEFDEGFEPSPTDEDQDDDLLYVIDQGGDRGPNSGTDTTHHKTSRLPNVSERAVATADPVAAYLAEIRKYPLLTREEEYELAVRLRETGDKEAAEKLVTSNLRFVVKVAAEYARFGSRLIDLIQEGNVGLMQAVKEFNPYKGVRLITYAVWWIRGYIQEHLMKTHSMVKIGTTQNQRKLFYKLQKERSRLEKDGEAPDLQIISQALNIPYEEVKEMAQRLDQRDLSLELQRSIDDRPVLETLQSREADMDLVSQIGTLEELSMLQESLEDLKSNLSERELELLEDRLLADPPLKLQEIAEKHGVSREAVRQMETRLIKKIKESLFKRLQDPLHPEES